VLVKVLVQKESEHVPVCTQVVDVLELGAREKVMEHLEK
jgi:hypothetical protein